MSASSQNRLPEAVNRGGTGTTKTPANASDRGIFGGSSSSATNADSGNDERKRNEEGDKEEEEETPKEATKDARPKLGFFARMWSRLVFSRDQVEWRGVGVLWGFGAASLVALGFVVLELTFLRLCVVSRDRDRLEVGSSLVQWLALMAETWRRGRALTWVLCD